MSPARFEDRPVAGMWPVAKRFLMSFPIRFHVLLRVPHSTELGQRLLFRNARPRADRRLSANLGHG